MMKVHRAAYSHEGLTGETCGVSGAPSRPGRTPHFHELGDPDRNLPNSVRLSVQTVSEEGLMNGLIYLIGLIVVIMAILSFFGLR